MTLPPRCPTFPLMQITVERPRAPLRPGIEIAMGRETIDLIDLIPSKIIGIGVNYRTHAAEMGKGIPEEPLMFLKPPSAVISDGMPIVRPSGYERVDYEGEL